GCFEATASRPRSRAAPRSSSTTGSRPERRCGPPRSACGSARVSRSSPGSRRAGPAAARCWPGSSIGWSASPSPSPSMASGSGTASSIRPATKRSAACSRPIAEEPNVPTAKPRTNHQSREVAVITDDATLDGQLEVPAEALGLVLFAHGSGSSRHSPRNRYVAEVLNNAKVATLLFDLLTSQEGERDAFDRSLRFDIELLAGRVIGAIDWVAEQAEIGELPIGLFGASTGAAAALVAAAARPRRVAAVVSRGG